ncbi:MAG TPA: ABC transporter ATP-binding protein, partial [Sphingomicrobium sp.]|nr:ABC transporter ATP-binding protein [Sphingomicrobium sp.]
RLTGDVKELQDFVAAIGIDVLPNVLTIVGMAVVMMIVDVRFALMAMVVAPLLIWLARSYATRLRQALRHVRRHEGALTGVAQEILSAVQVVQAFGRESDEDRRFAEHAGESLNANLKANAIQSQFGPMMNVSIAAATGLISWYGAASVINGAISPGELLIFLAYFRGMAAPARQIAKTGRTIGRAVVAFERIGEYRALRSNIANSPHAAAPQGRARAVQFDRVEFAYRAGHPVLKDISLVLEPGRTVALVGATGSGKSTVAGLVPRFYDPTAGTVTLDGTDLRELPLQYIRRQIALVLQEPVLFQASVWENIAYGLEGAGRLEAIGAAEAVGVADIIERLPDGFETLVSERGQTLSGGQRQCVSIARAMLRDAPIVILDEPSSSLDSRSEKRIMAAIERLIDHRAALVIAHRLSTVMKADEILVMERGCIVQRGSHSDLVGSGGTYSMLWQAMNEELPPAPLRLVAQ